MGTTWCVPISIVAVAFHITITATLIPSSAVFRARLFLNVGTILYFLSSFDDKYKRKRKRQSLRRISRQPSSHDWPNLSHYSTRTGSEILRVKCQHWNCKNKKQNINRTQMYRMVTTNNHILKRWVDQMQKSSDRKGVRIR